MKRKGHWVSWLLFRSWPMHSGACSGQSFLLKYYFFLLFLRNFVVLFSFEMMLRATSRNFCARHFNKKEKITTIMVRSSKKKAHKSMTSVTGLACDPAVLDASKCRGIDAAAAFIQFPRGLTTLLYLQQTNTQAKSK